MEAVSQLYYDPTVVADLSGDWDSVVVVAKDAKDLPASLAFIASAIEAQIKVDAAAASDATVVALSQHNVPANRVIFSPTGPLNRDHDDVRRLLDAAVTGMKRAIKAGSKKPVLVVPTSYGEQFTDAVLATWLGAFYALYTPIEIREDVPEKTCKITKLGLWSDDQNAQATLNFVTAVELGRTVTRDVHGSDPERMAAPNVEKYLCKVFKDSCIKMDVIKGHETFKQEFPLLAAVDRCANEVERHQGRVITLEYDPGDASETVFLVGKGITYDTGGADIKAGGVMAGMHRDKGGASAVAGLFKVLSILKPKGIKFVGQLAMVRNSVGKDCYVADEIITSRAKVRVKVGNTDAEGRMAMTDLLCRAKEWAASAVNPHIITIATLTGHVIKAYGPNYTAVMDNGPAQKVDFAKRMQKTGDDIGDVFEVSTIRREDYDFVMGKSEYEDVLQCNNVPSSLTPRGHQFPAAFMIRASGMDKHGRDSEKPIRYSHMDIAGSSGLPPSVVTAAPVPALAKFFVYGKY